MQEPAQAGAARPARLTSFHELMRQRVRRILLVSSLYDSFIMSEEGQLQESLLNQFLSLHLDSFPDVVQVDSHDEALRALAGSRAFDLVIASVTVGGAGAAELARRMRAAGRAEPVLALAYTGAELRRLLARETDGLERSFLWQGDVRLLLAMVAYVEDRLNVALDSARFGVPVILVVEDSVRAYSSFLPAIYTEIYRHTERLLSEGLNLSQKMMRMRARPKVLLCTTHEEALESFERYEGQVLGIVSDFELPRGGRLDGHAGPDLCRHALARRPDVRVVLQSSERSNRAEAQALGASFLLKGSPVLLQDLRQLLVARFGFGDFVFRLPDGSEVARAGDLKAFAERLASVPAESLVYHAERNHVSYWLKARTELALAEELRPRRLSDFDGPEHLRAELLARIEAARARQARTVIADFDRERFDPRATFTRVGGGSLGGKARGLAFASRVLADSGLAEAFPGVAIEVPPSLVLGTEVFERFLERPDLDQSLLAEASDEEIVRRFLEAPFPREAVPSLHAFLQRVRVPLAVRSSGLLEDSLSQPFAGVYRTFLLPNNHLDAEPRWQQLAAAIKRVYASVFEAQARGYLEVTSYRLEEERMAVMIQTLVGRAHEGAFYPDFAGVARSHDFYPLPGQEPADGVAAVALGLGRTVVEGGACLRFSPRHPRRALGSSSPAEALRASQREFFALDLARELEEPGLARQLALPLAAAERDGVLARLGSTYVPEDDRIVPGIARAGVRLVRFAQVLEGDELPLAPVLEALLARCSRAMGGPVEIEFAGELARPGAPARFALLQLRPLALSQSGEAVAIEDAPAERFLCRSRRILGNGRIDGVRDLVVVQREGFRRERSAQAAQAVARFDALLRAADTPYVLIGVGRWGSADPALGIPVRWHQIAGAQAIVEASFEDLAVEPSQGTHFFQNLVAGSVGYFTVDAAAGDRLDWDWLAAQPAVAEDGLVRHLRLERPLVVQMDGRAGEGAILKPA